MLPQYNSSSGTAGSLQPGLLYFAYGCNMDAAVLAEVVGLELAPGWPARLEGWRLAFNLTDTETGGRVVASLAAEAGCRTYGVVYRLPRAALAALDAFEEVPERYRRETFWVQPLGRRARQAALVYLGQPRWTVAEREPEREYLDTVLRGAREHGLPDEYVAWIRARATGEARGCYRESASLRVE